MYILNLPSNNYFLTHNIVSVVAAPHHLRRHVLDGAAEGVGPLLGLMRQELPGKNIMKINLNNI